MTERFEGEGAKAYDSRIPLLVPGYELLHQLCASRLMAALGQEARVLLVGVGTGSELLLLGRLCPRWTFVAQDISADMLAQARMRAEQAGMGERVCWHLGALPVVNKPCDGALCLLVLHFLAQDAKATLLGDIYRQLNPGAPLLLADLMAPTDPLERKSMGLQAALAGLPLPACEQMVRRLGEDFTSLDEGQTRRLLQGAGFAARTASFRRWGFTAGWRSGSEPWPGGAGSTRGPLQRQQCLLDGQASRIAGEAAILADHPVAGDDDGERIAAVRGTHRPHRVWLADGAGDVAVAAGLPVGDVAQRLPHRLLKRRAPGGERQGEALQPAREVVPKLGEEGGERLAVLLPVLHVGQRPQSGQEVHMDQTALVDGDQQFALVGGHHVIADHGLFSSSCVCVGRVSSAGCSLMACHSQLAA